ncbi:MAG: BLUF domain-containing protein [Bacteroidota bacterium]
MVFYTIYTSTPTGETSQSIVEQITQESIKWNVKHNITGMLICMEGRYLQFLEGDEDKVVEIFEKIKNDPRHKDVSPKIKGYSTDRVFSEWSMGSWMLKNEEIEELKALEELRNYLNSPINKPLQSKKYFVMMDNILKTWLVHEPERAERLKNRAIN